MTKGQKIILAFAIFSYIGVLVSFFLQINWVMFIFIIASSMLLISFNLAGSGSIDMLEAEKNEEIEKIQTELVSAKRDNEEVLMKLMDKENAINETMKLYKSAKEELKEAQAQVIKAQEETERTKDEAERKKQKAVDAAVEEALANVRMSIDEMSYEGMDALIPNIKEEEVSERVELVTLIKETADEFEKYANDAQVVIKVNAAAKEVFFECDPMRIRICLRNIIDNAIKYMKRAGSLIITISTVGDEVFIVLKDNGEGLSSAETKHVFELNYQGSNRISGNGLGLTQAKAIVNKYKGSIYAKSEAGNGMGIYIQLPIDKPQEQENNE